MLNMEHKQEEGDYFRQLTPRVVFLTDTFLVCVKIKIAEDDWHVCWVETGLIGLVEECVLPGSCFSEWASKCVELPLLSL